MRTETTVGRIILNRLGAESRYAAERQFVVCPDRTGWILRPLGGTPNATRVNGRPVRSKVRLDAGDVVSLGPWIGTAGRERLPARVEIRMEVRR
jgi:pSer/pThr/pTyr-binding forkhead associated (FHA) protein